MAAQKSKRTPRKPSRTTAAKPSAQATAPAAPSPQSDEELAFVFTRDFEIQQFGIRHPNNPKFKAGDVELVSPARCRFLTERKAGYVEGTDPLEVEKPELEGSEPEKSESDPSADDPSGGKAGEPGAELSKTIVVGEVAAEGGEDSGDAEGASGGTSGEGQGDVSSTVKTDTDPDLS